MTIDIETGLLASEGDEQVLIESSDPRCVGAASAAAERWGTVVWPMDGSDESHGVPAGTEIAEDDPRREHTGTDEFPFEHASYWASDMTMSGPMVWADFDSWLLPVPVQRALIAILVEELTHAGIEDAVLRAPSEEELASAFDTEGDA